MSETSSAPAGDRKSKWKSKKRISGITLPSGEVVDIELPLIPEMLRAGTVPNELVSFATKTQENIGGVDSVDIEEIKEATEFMRWLVSETVKSPAIEPDDVPELPASDVDMLLEFALRQRDTDAIGHHLHGLEKVSAWRNFRYGRLGD